MVKVTGVVNSRFSIALNRYIGKRCYYYETPTGNWISLFPQERGLGTFSHYFIYVKDDEEEYLKSLEKL